jgi:hypothetical protein
MSVAVPRLLVLFLQAVFAQSVGIATAVPNSSAALEVDSDRRNILIPRKGRTTLRFLLTFLVIITS